MRRTNRRSSGRPLRVVLIMILGLSLLPIACTQEGTWKALIDQAEALQKQGNYREAIPVAVEAMKVAEDTFGPNHPKTAISLDLLADLFRLQRQYSKAEPLYKRALKINMKVWGPDDPDVAMNISGLARGPSQ